MSFGFQDYRSCLPWTRHLRGPVPQTCGCGPADLATAARPSGLPPERARHVTDSEEVSLLATAARAPIVYWLLGDADPATFIRAAGHDDLVRIVSGLPCNYSPLYVPVED